MLLLGTDTGSFTGSLILAEGGHIVVSVPGARCGIELGVKFVSPVCE